MRRDVTIPAAGKSIQVPMTGISVQVEEAPLYDNKDQVPLLGFNSGNNQFPIYPRSIYQNPQGKFQNMVVQGTTESAGDVITLLSFSECLQSDIKIQFADTYQKTLKDTATKAASDAVQQFTDVELANSEGKLPSKLYIWVAGGATAGINYAFGADPSQGLNPTDAAQWDNDQSNAGTANHEIQLDFLEIEGINWIQAFKFIATVNTEIPNLIWTPEY